MKALKILAMMVLMNALLLYPIAADAQSGARVDADLTSALKKISVSFKN